MTQLKFEAQWLKEIQAKVSGRKIELVRYMTREEAKAFGWRHRPIVIQLDDRSIIYPVADADSTEPAVLATNQKDLPIIPCAI